MKYIIDKIKALKMDQPDTSPWGYDMGWNSAIDEVVKILELEQGQSKQENSDQKGQEPEQNISP